MSNLTGILKNYSRSFWASNTLELFERWAWYGFYMAFAIYLVGSKDTGAMGFSQVQKALIMSTGSMLLYFLPVVTGAIADKIGYKKVLYLAYILYISGFYMINIFDTYEMVFFAFIWTSVGGAFFKPIVSAMISKTTTDETASIGFGIFYMMINIGGFIGPFIAGIVLQKSWEYVFYLSMATIAINILITFLFFKEPALEQRGGALFKSIKESFKNIWITLQNWRYVLFLVIMILFWTAFNQLYYSFPVFISQWVDTGSLYNGIATISPWLARSIGTPEGTITAVTLSSMDSFFIIVFQIMVSSFVMRFKPLSAMMGGILVLAGGLGLMFSTQIGWLVLLGILIFSLGEMASSPKFTEYVGKIAPADKKALYMGTSFLPIAAAHQLCGWLSGSVYEKTSDNIYLLKMEMASRNIDMPAISNSFTKNDYMSMAANKLSMTQPELIQYLWSTYHPSKIWIIYSGIAVSAVVLLWLYNRFILTNKN